MDCARQEACVSNVGHCQKKFVVDTSTMATLEDANPSVSDSPIPFVETVSLNNSSPAHS